MISNQKLLEIFKVLVIKFSSIAIMSFIFLFLWLYEGFNGIGKFAAITAIIAPLEFSLNLGILNILLYL